MKTKFRGILTLLLAFVVQLTFAQEKTISGAVTDNTGLPLPGVNIIIKGTSNGTQSDFDGNYTLQASVGQTIVFSYVGFKSTEKAITASTSTMNVQMEEDAAQLEEVIITAQGIKKEKKALGYSVSTVKAEQVQENPQTDLTRILSGKSAGINITSQSGLTGSSNQVVIRGLTSFSGSNNALYIIDGVPYSNDTNTPGNFQDGNMGSSRSFDIDPNNIERVDILKGLAATTLYGTEGRNGVILITTKTGSSKNINTKQEIQLSTSYFVNEVGGLPDYQDKFGGGFNQGFGWFYSNWGPGFYKDGLGGWGSDINFDENGTLPHPYSTSAYLTTNYPEYQALFFDENGDNLRYDWKPRNSVEEFFRKGIAKNLSASIKGRSKNGDFGYAAQFSHLDEDGFTPGNNVKRNNLTIAGDAKLNNKLSIRGSMTYSNTNLKTPPIGASFGSSTTGTGSSIFGDLIYTPRSVDLFELPFEIPSDGSSIYYRDDNAIQNPLWTLKNARFSQLVNRVNGYAAVNYNINDHFTVSYQGSVDNYTEQNVNRQNKGGVSDFSTIHNGFYHTYTVRNTIYDHRIILDGKDFSFFKEKFNLGFSLGATSKSTNRDQSGLYSDNQIVFGFFDHSNFTNQTSLKDIDGDGSIDVDTEDRSSFNINGLFAQVNLDYNNIVYLNLSGRQDWVSNAFNNTKFYPSASLSFIPTSAFKSIKSDKGINYLKLRASYGTSAHFADRYPTSTTISANPNAYINNGGTTIITNTTNDNFGNIDIKPELIEEYEYGIEGKIFNRLSFDVSLYNRNTIDLIVDIQVPASTGYTSTTTNIGKIETNGIEAELGLDIFKNKTGFNWNLDVNYTSLESKVVDLGQDADFIPFGAFTNLGNAAESGNPITAIYGARVARDENGNKLVNDAGSYVFETTDENDLTPMIGDTNPDFVMNYISTMSWKGITLGAQVSHVSGGDIYSATVATLMGRGLTTDTENRLGTFILDGVNETTGEPNNIQIDNSTFYFDNGFAHGADELSVYDASVIRLQELSLGYQLTPKMLEKTPFGKIGIKFSAFNLWYDAYNIPDGTNFDPNTSSLGAGNGSGFEFLTGPSSKRYGVTINASF